MMRLLLCMILYLVGVIQAAPTTNATTTSEYFEAPSFTNRTLSSIISSSVLTLFACVYTAIHPNIPSPEDSPFYILRRRLGIMIVALVVPELVVVWAMRQWTSARKVTEDFEESGYFNVPRPQKQSENRELAEVPAEQLEDHDRARLLDAPAEASTFKKLFQAYFSNQSEDYAWTQTHSFFLLMGGFMLYVDGEPYITLEPHEILNLIREGCIDAPTLTAKQIGDKSKGNVISKGLVILQVTWFILQLITRAIYHLETTQLETGTLAFAVLNFLTYALWWNKPLDVQCPYPVYWKSTESKLEDHINVVTYDDEEDVISAIIVPILELTSSFVYRHRLRVPTFDGSLGARNKWILVFAGILIATTFGGIHCIAWFFTFPTNLEQVLWRISAVAITCTPCLEYLSFNFIFGDKITIKPEIIRQIIYMLSIVTTVTFGLLYIVGRVMLVVLMFTTLRHLPLDAYTTVSWISLVPHL
ncbi:hypothetical protein DEU56DRAFT_91310 [Suillus clintonianus]|uniref:uncharacterized protein n=1 Tax=Suillus clintonianus TaxID=1904413 RepID=UPI001B879323|nr:uncharacterized protein DEU56DRAFT_91310 [Suillus clintonianus]KAG2121882.1 hypothetical protein DEU56DRAFT_91310 [Suillus clintonianus]